MSKNDLVPATKLVETNQAHFPNESPEYRNARNALLVEEIELRRQIERVARHRRALPPGGEVKKAYAFESESGPVSFAELFGDKDTLIIYSYMFGPARKDPCPMCTSFMRTWDKKIADVEERAALFMMARSPISRLVETKKALGYGNLKVLSDPSGDYTRDYVSAEDADMAGISVFSRKDGTIRHFWSAEMSGEMADPGQDPRGAPDMDPLWAMLDVTPEGRGDWYPSLEYANRS